MEKIYPTVLGTCKALWLYMPFLKYKNHSPINKNIHGSLAEVLEVKRLIGYYYHSCDKKIFISDVEL